jgi:hypothetical protein
MNFQTGIKFEGTNGWVFVSRGDYQVTASDPTKPGERAKKIDASDPKILTSVIGEKEFHFTVSKEHHGNWLEAIRDNKATIAPVEEAHRACSGLFASSYFNEAEKKTVLGSKNRKIQKR